MAIDTQNITPSETTASVGSYNREQFDAQGWRIEKVAKIALRTLTVASLATTLTAIAVVCILTTSWSLAIMVTSIVASSILLVGQVTPFIKPHLPHSLRTGVNIAHSFVVDFFAKVAIFSLYPFSQTGFNPKDKSEIDENQTPILLTHGYLMNSSCWRYFRYRMKKAGLKNIFTINLGQPFLSVEKMAAKVQKKAEEIRRITGRNDLKLVGHSMGGVVNSYYATNHAPEGSIKSVITIGSPLKGTKIGVIGIGKCAREMQYKSQFTQDLTQKIEQSNLPFYHIGSKTDFIIQPYTSSIIKKHKFTMFDDLGHGSFIFSDRVIRLCVEELLSSPHEAE